MKHKKNRSKKTNKIVSIMLLLIFSFDILRPTFVFASSTSPIQAEFSSFSPSGATEMVNLFTGDFSYNIPLLDVDGYPIGLSYNADVKMNQEASWVGLGWTLNPGNINRNTRGLPDDFDGDVVEQTTSFKPQEIVGKRETDVSATIRKSDQKGYGNFTNSYLGRGYDKIVGHNEMSVWALLIRGKTSANSKYYNTQTGIGISNSEGYSKGGILLPMVMSFVTGAITSALTYGAASVSVSFNRTKQVTNTDNFSSRKGLISKTTSFSKTLSGGISASVGIGGSPFSAGGGISGSKTKSGYSVISQGTQTYFPSIPHAMFGTGLNVNITQTETKGGGKSKSKSSDFYQSKDELFLKTIKSPAFGYLSLENSNNKNNALLDFNREKDGAFISTQSSLPISALTYDMFYASAEGLFGSYRAYRNDVGAIKDPVSLIKKNAKSYSVGFSSGSELVPIISSQSSISIGKGTTNSTSLATPWLNSNSTSGGNNELLSFKSRGINNNYESYFFRSQGEKFPLDLDFYNSFGSNYPAMVGLKKTPTPPQALTTSFPNSLVSIFKKYFFETFLELKILNPAGMQNITPTTSQRNLTERSKRKQLFSIMPAKKAQYFSIDKKIESKSAYIGNTGESTVTEIERVSDLRKGHHISEVTVNREDGTRYVFGLPVYSISQNDVTFSVGAPDLVSNCVTGLVSYNSTDNSINNNKGLDNFFSNKKVPSYSNGFLLTSVLSNDFVDVDDNGPSDKDLGTYTKFNYTQVYGTTNPYNWRIPYTETSNQTVHAKGWATDKMDDKAIIAFGEKEIWYVQSVETKNYIAEFYLDNREDAYSALNINGGRDNLKPLKKLSKIILFAKEDRKINRQNAVPLKTIEFEYDYSLCKQIPQNSVVGGGPNNQGGKLTLKKIYITTGTSKKGRLSPFVFEYSDKNPNYDLLSVDNWDNYKPNSCNSNELNNDEFPFILQSLNGQSGAVKTVNDEYASSWKLNKILTPSGAEINVEYESDDYAYVQNRKAMQMMRLEGIDGIENINLFSPSTPKNKLYEMTPVSIPIMSLTVPLLKSKNVLFFKLQDGDVPSSLEDFKNRYFDGGFSNLYYSFLIDVNNKNQYERISGYAPIKSVNYINLGPPNVGCYGYIELEGQNEGSFVKNINSIVVDTWQALRGELSNKIYNNSNCNCNTLSGNAFKSCIDQCINQTLSVDIATVNSTLYDVMASKNFGANVNLKKSWIRLNSPKGFKLGGGHRVKKISISDNWDNLSAENKGEVVLTQEFDYTTKNENGVDISSGVTSYEPSIGAEENPFRQPDFYYVNYEKFPDEKLYIDYPYGESFFPTPMVGYSKVKVISNSNPAILKNNVGYTVNEFYTAKDFPTITSKTGAKVIKQDPPVIPKPVIKFFGKNKHAHKLQNSNIAVSDGFVIELNDMHGKFKAISEFNGNGVLVYNVKNYYRSKNDVFTSPSIRAGQGKNVLYKLDNNVSVIESNGIISQKVVGVEMDVSYDTRKIKSDFSYSSKSLTAGASTFLLSVQGSLDVTDDGHNQEDVFSSISFSKILYNYGMQYKTETYANGETTINEDIAYDAETGDPIITRVQNNWGDPLYSITIPAHWAYDALGGAYINDKVILEGVSTDAQGVISSSYINYNLLKNGDLISLDGETDPYWIYESQSQKFIMNKLGAKKISLNNGTIEILRSGRKNMQSLPAMNILALTDLYSYINTGLRNIIQDVISADAYTFSDQWNTNCEIPYDNTKTQGCIPTQLTNCTYSYGSSVNPFIVGTSGLWRLKETKDFSSNRVIGANGIRKNGTINNFSSYWSRSLSNTWVENSGWQTNTEVTQYGTNGQVFEAKDKRGIFSASLWGYNNKLKNLPIAVASPAKYSQIAFDAFEDYYYKSTVLSNCWPQGHFDFRDKISEGVEVTNTQKHTGLSSLKIYPNTSISTIRIVNLSDCKPLDILTSATDLNCNCLKQFSPTSGEYFFSVWVKENTFSPTETYLKSNVNIKIVDDSGVEEQNVVFVPKGKIINGWQKVEGVFNVSPNSNCFIISLNNTSTTNNGFNFFDDLRIHPLNAEMKSFVYNINTLQPMAELDENNFAKIYEVDESQQIVRTKLETTNGIQTLIETNSSVKLRPN